MFQSRHDTSHHNISLEMDQMWVTHCMCLKILMLLASIYSFFDRTQGRLILFTAFSLYHVHRIKSKLLSSQQFSTALKFIKSVLQTYCLFLLFYRTVFDLTKSMFNCCRTLNFHDSIISRPIQILKKVLLVKF